MIFIHLSYWEFETYPLCSSGLIPNVFCVWTDRKIYKSILIYIQQDTTLHSSFYLETALHVSDGTIAHHQERKQLYLQHLVLVTTLLLSAAIVEELELV